MIHLRDMSIAKPLFVMNRHVFQREFHRIGREGLWPIEGPMVLAHTKNFLTQILHEWHHNRLIVKGRIEFSNYQTTEEHRHRLDWQIYLRFLIKEFISPCPPSEYFICLDHNAEVGFTLTENPAEQLCDDGLIHRTIEVGEG